MSERIEFFIKGKKLRAEPYHYVESGLDNVFLLNGVTEKATSYGPMIHIENVNGLHHAIGLHIVEKSKPMTGAEFRFLRKQLEMSQVELAEYLSVTDQTVANYEKEKGKTGIGPAEAAIRALYLLKVLPKHTRVAAMKPLIGASDHRRRLSDVPREKIVEKWHEEEMVAA